MPDAPRPVFEDMRIGIGNKLARGAWGIVETLLYRPSPIFAHRWRCLLLRLFGARIGNGVHPYPRARVWAPWNLVMEDGSSFADDVICYNVAAVRLGRDAVVSQHAYLCTASRDIDRTGKPVIAAPITIGAGAWVAVQAFVGPGVTIGDNAVVGARSTVLRDVAADSVVAGSPLRLLRMRAPS